MRMLEPGEILIPYGSARAPGDLLRVDGARVECRMAHVVVRPGGGLRLNSGGYEAGYDIGAEEMPPFEMLRAHLGRYCDLWRPAQRGFVDSYFEWVAAEVGRNRDSLSGRLSSFGELYDVTDWRYSAFRPLPQAWFSVAPGGSGPYDATNLVAADIAFWTGGEIVVVDLTRPGTPDPRRAEALLLLRQAGVQVVEIPPAAQGGPLDAVLPDSLRRFWNGPALPAGPFRPDLPRDLIR